jgi:CDP-4-dehydro-6-deoxyglucose reductase, E3
MVRVTLGSRTIELRPGEYVLDGLLRSGAYFPYQCRTGSCQTCMAQALEGVPPAISQQNLADEQRAARYFLACVCVPDEDLVVRVVY